MSILSLPKASASQDGTAAVAVRRPRVLNSR